MKLGIVFTNDWELFGNGSGDYFEVQHNPLLEFLATMEEYGAKLTIMAEVFQQFKHNELKDQHPKIKEISDAWDSVIVDSIKRGHDVQLHLHPQWTGAEYIDNRWKLNMELSHLSKFGYEDIREMLSNGRSYLEEIITPVKNDYRCLAFRAGGYFIQPEENAIRALKETGFKCDTSVTKGFYNPGYYDFRSAVSNIMPWKTTASSLNIKSENNEGLLELPIYSDTGFDSPVLKKFFPALYYRLRFGSTFGPADMEWFSEKDKVKEKRYPKDTRYYKSIEKRNLSWYMRAFLNRSPIQLDYDYLPPQAFASCIKNIFNSPDMKKFENTDIIFPVISSGHIKDVHNSDNIRGILKELTHRFGDKITFIKLSDAYHNWNEVS